MGKVSPTSIKYIIKAKFHAEGAVEKPDIIGAVFGQTEGLLGEDLELRELQKNGKIGRIDVNVQTVENKTEGEIEIPTSLDKAETTIIAATLETIEKIGPCDSKIIIEKIEDVRSSKREYVMERAKALLSQLSSSQPDAREMGATVTTMAREAKIKEFGKEMLPAGPDMDNREIIVVEGRADVVNLLRYGMNNVIGMNGTVLPKTIAELGMGKELTLFVDGDRGGLLIAKNVIANARISYVAVAPDGKEVEELVGKEIIYALRGKIKTQEFVDEFLGERRTSRARSMSREDYKRKFFEREERAEPKTEMSEAPAPELEDEKVEKLREILSNMIGTKGACLLDSGMRVIKKFPVSELQNIPLNEKPDILVMDGIVTNNVAKTAEMVGCRYLVAKNFAITIKTRINLISV